MSDFDDDEVEEGADPSTGSVNPQAKYDIVS